VITAVGLAALPRRRLRGIALALAAFTGLAQLCFLSTQWGHRVVPEENWLRSPLPEGLLNLRGYDLASLGDPALQGLHGHAEKLLALAEREIPRSERLKYIAVLSPWGQMTEPADALAYLLPLERSDLVVIPLANMSYAAQAGFDGLEPSDFAYLLQLDGTRVVPCCHVQVSTQDAQDPNLVPVREFLDRLNEVSAGAVEDWPELVRLPAATR